LLSGTGGPNTDINSKMQDYLYGGDGEDEVRGLGASDELYGGVGSDVIYGGPGANYLEAQQDDDVIYGGATATTTWCREALARTSSMAGMAMTNWAETQAKMSFMAEMVTISSTVGTKGY
jgi:Ca2+-binding RTX toxin-like protein